MTEEAAIGASQTAESAQAEQAAPKFLDVNEFLKEQGIIASESFLAATQNLSEDEHIGLTAEPLVTKAERDMLLEEPAEATVLVAPCPLTLEQYLRLALNEVPPQAMLKYNLTACKNAAGDIVFYVHPVGDENAGRHFTVMGELTHNISNIAA